MASFKFRGNVGKALYEGFTPQEISKQLKKEYANYKKALRRTISEGRYYNENIKSDLTPLINKAIKDQRRDLTYLNPAREQIKKLKAIKIKLAYQKPVLVYKKNDQGKRIIPDWEWVRTDVTKAQKKTLDKFVTDYSKKVYREIRRFHTYKKALNLNALTVQIRGQDISLSQLYKDYLSTQDSTYKALLRKKLNYAFKQIRTIQVSKHGNNKRRVYRGKLEDVKDGDLPIERVSNYNLYTRDNNDNVFGWEIISQVKVINGDLWQKGKNKIIWESHWMKLQSAGVDVSQPYFMDLWDHLRREYS